MAKKFTRSFDLSDLIEKVKANADDDERGYLRELIELEFSDRDWVGSFKRGHVELMVQYEIPSNHYVLRYIKSICNELHLGLSIERY